MNTFLYEIKYEDGDSAHVHFKNGIFTVISDKHPVYETNDIEELKEYLKKVNAKILEE